MMPTDQPSRSSQIERIGLPPTFMTQSLRDLDQQLAEILALQQAEEGGRRVLQPFDHVLAILDLAAAQPLRHVAQEVALLGREIPDDEAAHQEALAQDAGDV